MYVVLQVQTFLKQSSPVVWASVDDRASLGQMQAQLGPVLYLVRNARTWSMMTSL